MKVSTSRPVVDIDETEVAADGESQVKESSGEHLRQEIALANLNELKKVEYQSQKKFDDMEQVWIYCN